MSDHYIIDSTDGTVHIGLAPGAYNGPNGPVTDSDLRLYGAGHRKWGEGVDENFYRMLENWSCPAKALNDYNPATGLNDFDPLTDPITPKDAHDLGGNMGINNPVKGQLWYNSSTAQPYMFNGTIWKPITSTSSGPNPPPNPDPGWLWYDTSVPQLKVWTGTAWDSVAKRYVLKEGDSMTGNLVMTGTSAITFPQSSTTGGLIFDDHAQKRISWNDGYGDFAIRAGHSAAGSPAGEKYVVTGDGASKVALTSDGAAGAISLKVAGIGTAGSAVTFGNGIDLTTTGITFTGNSTFANDVTVSGGTMSLNNGTSNAIVWNSAGLGAPTFTSRSVGTKLVLYPTLSATLVDYALGINSSTLWTSVPNTASVFAWYAGNTTCATLTGAGVFTTNKLSATASGGADNIAVGNDAYIGDVNVANTLAIRGATNSSVATLRFGSTGTPGDIAYNGSAFSLNKNVGVTGSLSVSGAISGSSLSVTGNINGANLGVSNAINCTSLLASGTVSGSSINVSSSAHSSTVTNLNADMLDGHHWSEVPPARPYTTLVSTYGGNRELNEEASSAGNNVPGCYTGWQNIDSSWNVTFTAVANQTYARFGASIALRQKGGDWVDSIYLRLVLIDNTTNTLTEFDHVTADGIGDPSAKFQVNPRFMTGFKNNLTVGHSYSVYVQVYNPNIVKHAVINTAQGSVKPPQYIYSKISLELF
jgi:hypothetical protein